MAFEGIGAALRVYLLDLKGGRAVRLSPRGEASVIPVAVAGSGSRSPSIAELSEWLSFRGDAPAPADLERLYLVAESAGLVTAATRDDDEPAVTLTQLAMDRLMVEPSGKGKGWMPRIDPPTILLDTDLAGKGEGWSGPLPRWPDDTATEPWEIVARSEEAAIASEGMRRVNHGLGEAKVPLPTVLVGERLQWPVLGSKGVIWTPGSGEPCPGCRDHPKLHEYCIVNRCDRSGRDHLLPKARIEKPRKVAAAQPKSLAKSRAQLRAEKFAKPSP